MGSLALASFVVVMAGASRQPVGARDAVKDLPGGYQLSVVSYQLLNMER